MAVRHLQQFLMVFALLQQGATQDQSEGGCQDKSGGPALLQKLSSQGSTVAKEDVAPESILGRAAGEDSKVNDVQEVGTANAGAENDKAVAPVRILERLLSDQVPDSVMQKMHDYTIRQQVSNGANINNEATINNAERIEPDLRHVQIGYQQEGSYYKGLNLAPMGYPYEGLPLLAHRNEKNHDAAKRNAETTPWWTLRRSTPWWPWWTTENSNIESDDVKNNDEQSDNLEHLNAVNRDANNSNAENQSAENNNMQIKEEENHDADNSKLEANEAKNISAMRSNEGTRATTTPTKKNAIAAAELPQRQKSEEPTHMQIQKAVHTESFDVDNHNSQEADKQDEVLAEQLAKAHAAEEANVQKPVSIEQMLLSGN